MTARATLSKRDDASNRAVTISIGSKISSGLGGKTISPTFETVRIIEPFSRTTPKFASNSADAPVCLRTEIVRVAVLIAAMSPRARARRRTGKNHLAPRRWAILLGPVIFCPFTIMTASRATFGVSSVSPSDVISAADTYGVETVNTQARHMQTNSLMRFETYI